MRRLIWLLLDGLPHWVLERYRDRSDRLPTLTRLVEAGRSCPLLPAFPNCQTPPSLASLYCGLEPGRTGLTGFHVPNLAALPMADSTPAFELGVQGTPRWLWEDARAAGARMRLLNVPFVDPEPLGHRLVARSFAFVPASVEPAVYQCGPGGPTARFGERELYCQRRAAGDYDVALTRAGRSLDRRRLGDGDAACLCAPDGWHVTVLVGRSDGVDRLLVLGSWQPRLAGRPDAVAAHTAAVGHLPAVAKTLSRPYRRGELGRTLHDDDDGDGQAERLLTRAVRVLAARYAAEAVHAAAARDSELILAYQPAVDLLLHELAGFLHADSAHHTPQRARVAEDLLLDVLADCDRLIADVCATCGDDDLVFVCSDHGMAPIDTILYPNEALRRRGLLIRDLLGGLDPARSVCFLHPAENGLLVFNQEGMARAGLTESQVLARLCQDLTAASGRQVRSFRYAGGPTAPDGWTAHRFLVPGPRCQLKSGFADALAQSGRKTGDHCVHDTAAELQGVFIQAHGAPFGTLEAIETHEVTPGLRMHAWGMA